MPCLQSRECPVTRIMYFWNNVSIYSYMQHVLETLEQISILPKGQMSNCQHWPSWCITCPLNFALQGCWWLLVPQTSTLMSASLCLCLECPFHLVSLNTVQVSATLLDLPWQLPSQTTSVIPPLSQSPSSMRSVLVLSPLYYWFIHMPNSPSCLWSSLKADFFFYSCIYSMSSTLPGIWLFFNRYLMNWMLTCLIKKVT